jgi:cell division topological specificity factor
MAIFDFFKKKTETASVAKDRLQIVVARERASTGDRVQSYLPQLQRELMEELDMEQVTVAIDKKGEAEVLEINIVLPEEKRPGRSVRTRQPALASM